MNSGSSRLCASLPPVGSIKSIPVADQLRGAAGAPHAM